MKNWKIKRTFKELTLLKELDEVSNDIRLVKKNKKKNYQRNKEYLSKISKNLQIELLYLSSMRRNTPFLKI